MLVALAAVALVAPAAGAAVEQPRTFVITISRMHYLALPQGLKVGDTIVWANRDIVPHTATARDHSFDVTLQPNQAKRIVIRHAGNIAFYCRYHPAMQGTLTAVVR
jgi:plastocyanin